MRKLILMLTAGAFLMSAGPTLARDANWDELNRIWKDRAAAAPKKQLAAAAETKSKSEVYKEKKAVKKAAKKDAPKTKK